MKNLKISVEPWQAKLLYQSLANELAIAECNLRAYKYAVEEALKNGKGERNYQRKLKNRNEAQLYLYGIRNLRHKLKGTK